MIEIIENGINELCQSTDLNAPKWNVERKNSSRPPAWNYIDGLMITALLSLGKAEFAERFVDNYIADDGTILGYILNDYNIDNINGGRNLFDLYKITKKEKYILAIEKLFKQLETHPRNIYGSFWHKKIYPNQVWLDGLYMGQVFYTRYLTELKAKNGFNDILLQFKNAQKFMFDEKKRLYYHGFDASKTAFWADKESGLSKSFWLRSIGWYLSALVDVISYLPEVAGEAKNELSQIFVEAMDGVMQYLDKEHKMYYQVVDKAEKDGNYLETSGSAMISYAALKSARLGITDDFKARGADIFDGITKKYLLAKGGKMVLGGICLVAGLGPENNTRRDGTFDYYITEPVVENDAKGLGAFLLAYSEYKKIKTNKH